MTNPTRTQPSAPLAVPGTRTSSASGRPFTVTAEPAAFPAAVLLFPVAKADKLPTAAVTGQAVGFPAAETVPPAVAAAVAAENLPPGRGWQGPAAVFTYVASVVCNGKGLGSVTVTDGFYGVWGEG